MREPARTTSTAIATAIRDAWARRSALHASTDTNAYRVFHGFAEGLPGLDLERYADALLVRSKGDLEADTDEILSAIEECHDFRWVGLKIQRRNSTHARALEVRSLRAGGDLPTDPIDVLDAGLTYAVEPYDRESTGLFLDARPARRWLLENSRDRRILNLFAFTGSLGVAAAKGGAAEVVHVDQRGSVLDRAATNHDHNAVPCDSRNFVRGNVYAHLPRAARAGQHFDGIILDPPPNMTIGRRKRRVKHQDYPKLTRLCEPLLADGGWLLCFFHRWDQSRAEYETQITEALGGSCTVVHRGTSGGDFPEANPEAKMRFSVFARG